MFERYTEAARRVIFSARYMADQVGSPKIETEHVLLGLLRTDKSLARRFLGSPWAAEDVWRNIEQKKAIRDQNRLDAMKKLEELKKSAITGQQRAESAADQPTDGLRQ
jgi:ATP-dependent Clp protease ATP-binding subunit ClpC